MSIKTLLIFFFAILVCSPVTTFGQDSRLVKENCRLIKAKDLYQLIYRASKGQIFQDRRLSLKRKRRRNKSLKEDDSDRKRLLPIDSCKNIFDADTIFVLRFKGSKGACRRVGFNEMIIGNGTCLNYANTPIWPEFKDKLKEVMDRILTGNYGETMCESVYFTDSYQLYLCFFITRQNRNTFMVSTNLFTWLDDVVGDNLIDFKIVSNFYLLNNWSGKSK